MRKAPVLILLGTLAACGGGGAERSQNSSAELTTMDAAEEPTSAGAPPPLPGIAPTAAPGVAFNYRYQFRLPGARVAQVQEQHAAACEKLGVARCRITALRYRLVGDDEIDAMLAFKLDPALARGFGKEGISAVQAAEGMLVDSEITGEDVGSRIAAATRSQAELEDELKRIEEQLARRGQGSSERAELQLRAQQLRDQLRGTRASKQQDQEILATTPMVFDYGSGDLLDGFDGRPRLSKAMDDAIDNFMTGILWILVALITLLPWALLIAAGLWLVRRLRPIVDRALTVRAPAPPPEA
jgi:hypothetical protein